MKRAPNGPPAPKAGVQARNYMFTVNFSKGFFRLLDPSLWAGSISYCVYQLEMGAQGTLHFQGYLECIGKRSFHQLHELEGLEEAHFEVRRGSQEAAIRYCTKKDETYLEGEWEWGEKKAQGSRSDLFEIQQKLDQRVPMSVISADHFASSARHHKWFREYRRIQTAPRSKKSVVFLFIGPPGQGKSTLMKLIASRVGTYYVAPQPKGSGIYFDDYDNQDVFILDEFDGRTMQPTYFNVLCDEHECVLPTHGGAGHQMVSKFIFIGTNYLPRQWWKNRNAVQIKQTTRRIDVVFKVGFANAERWDHSGFQDFGPNINKPRKRPRPGDIYGLPPLDGG